MSSVDNRAIWEKGCSFLSQAVRRLSEQPFAEISNWPEWPGKPSIDLEVPEELSSIQFTLMKDTQPDGTIRVAIQMHQRRSRFLAVGVMHADGFFLSQSGDVRWFTEEDTWAVT